MAQAMDDAVKFLKGSHLYQMSLGSKELYHSNVWAWLIENDHEFAKIFFPELNLSTYEVTDVKREYNNRDLVVFLHTKGATQGQRNFHCVVENKIKSLPTIEQLQRYAKNLDNATLLYATLTGLRDTLGNVEHWQFCSSVDVAKGIRERAEASQAPVVQQYKEQIEEYCRIIDNIYDLLGAALENEPDRLSFEHDASLDDMAIRLGDVYKKFKAATFLDYCKGRQGEIGKPDCYEWDIAQGFSHSDALLDMCFSNKKDGTGRYLRIGIQIQGYQYRRIAEMDRATASIDAVFNSLSGSWFDDTPVGSRDGKVFGHNTRMKKAYCSFNVKDSNDVEGSFVYQYYNLDRTNNIYEALFTQIKEDLQKAKEIVEAM